MEVEFLTIESNGSRVEYMSITDQKIEVLQDIINELYNELGPSDPRFELGVMRAENKRKEFEKMRQELMETKTENKCLYEKIHSLLQIQKQKEQQEQRKSQKRPLTWCTTESEDHSSSDESVKILEIRSKERSSQTQLHDPWKAPLREAGRNKTIIPKYTGFMMNLNKSQNLHCSSHHSSSSIENDMRHDKDRNQDDNCYDSDQSVQIIEFPHERSRASLRELEPKRQRQASPQPVPPFRGLESFSNALGPLYRPLLQPPNKMDIGPFNIPPPNYKPWKG